ncbi:uncharacterized protein G2W53_029264 [Senna tora]|uniref:Uncharacterized protein n=1 Tax=Senna tora TaxID=362788 RepID=A0A834T5C0_9FABA|nr:uncharacterized protein G2W53_029264 [Senna tora]
MSPKKTTVNTKTSHERDQPKMIKKEEEEEDLRIPNEEDDNKQEDIISKDLNVRSSAHIDFEDSFEKSPELFCIADNEIPGDIPDFQTLVLEFNGKAARMFFYAAYKIWNRHNDIGLRSKHEDLEEIWPKGSVVEEWNLLINEETKPRCDGEAIPRSILKDRREECA